MNKIVKYSLSADCVTGTFRTALACQSAVRRPSEPGRWASWWRIRRSCLLRSRASHQPRVAASPTVFSTPADRQPPSSPLSRHRHLHAANASHRSQPSERTPPLRYSRYIITLTARRSSMPKIIILSRRRNATRHITVLLRPRSVARHVVFHVPAADTPCITPAPLNTPADGSVERPIVID